jgi:hypothetical protein
MDRAYNENYRDALDDQFRRGIDVGQQTTQYEVVTIVEDVNEYAASDMLEVLKDVSAYLGDELSETPETEDPDAHTLLKRVNEAILNGEARG